MIQTILSIGVRDLVEFALQSGDLKVEFASAARAVDAIRIHQKIQYGRPAGYLPELTVSSSGGHAGGCPPHRRPDRRGV